MPRWMLTAALLLIAAATGASAEAEPRTEDVPVLRPLPLAEGIRDVLNRGGDLESLKTKEQYKFAKAQGIDLALPQPDPVIAHAMETGRLFYVFYKTLDQAYGPKRYVIQRIKRTKRSWETPESAPTEEVTYQVEVFKLFGGALKRADQHYGDYGHQNKARREVVKEYEIGFGEIPGHVEGDAWPFADSRLFEYVYRYGPDAATYDAVRFGRSVKWTLTVELTKDGTYGIRSPELGLDVPARPTDVARTLPAPDPRGKDLVLVRGRGLDGIEPNADWLARYTEAVGPIAQDIETPSGNRNIVFRAGLLANRRPDGTLNTVQTRPGFAGRTKKGIAIGDDRADVMKAYGAPRKAAADAIWWHYGDIGFWFDGLDRVGRIYVRIRTR